VIAEEETEIAKLLAYCMARNSLADTRYVYLAVASGYYICGDLSIIDAARRTAIAQLLLYYA
jgi:hypothetical protein